MFSLCRKLAFALGRRMRVGWPKEILLVVVGVAYVACAPDVAAQDIGDPAGVAGVESVALRASADWDELITTEAGGATEAQFVQALSSGLADAFAGAEAGPRHDPEAADFVLCHVDTFYDRGLIVYSARVSLHRPGASGRPVVTWLRSWVGSYTAQQLHVIWSIADQCAEAFLEAWAG